MKTNTMGAPSATGANEVAADISILIQLSALHATQVRLRRERDSQLGVLAERLKDVEQLAANLETDLRRLPITPLPESEPPSLGRLRALLDERKHDLGRARADLDASNRDLMPQIAEMAGQAASVGREADRLASGLSTAASRAYLSLARTRRLPFAVSLKGDCCGGCNLRLPSSLLGEVRRVPRLYRCPSCNRVVSTDTTPPS